MTATALVAKLIAAEVSGDLDATAVRMIRNERMALETALQAAMRGHTRSSILDAKADHRAMLDAEYAQARGQAVATTPQRSEQSDRIAVAFAEATRVAEMYGVSL